MSPTPQITSKSWVLSGLTIWMFATGFERALQSTDKWLAEQGSLRYLGLLLTPVALGLAAYTSASNFLRKYGVSQSAIATQRVLVPSFLLIWSVLSLLLIGTLKHFPSGFLSYSLFYMAESLVGCLLGYGAVLLAVRQHGRWTAKDASV